MGSKKPMAFFIFARKGGKDGIEKKGKSVNI
jgi:hypothetical protein